MRQKLIILAILALSSCKSIYLESTGTIQYITEDTIVVFFNCANSKRPDCQGWATYSKENFPHAYIGQKLELK